MSQITKRALEQSLKHLLLKKPLTKITINDITEDCGINRMTFYYHFKDIYDLVEWSCLEEQVEKYLQPLVDQLLLDVLNEEVGTRKVRDEDKQFIAQIYAYILIGLMLDWIKEDMREDPQQIVNRLAKLIKGSMSAALARFQF